VKSKELSKSNCHDLHLKHFDGCNSFSAFYQKLYILFEEESDLGSNDCRALATGSIKHLLILRKMILSELQVETGLDRGKSFA
jgi:hypothetical protein